MDEVDNKEKQGNKPKAGPSFSITERIEDFIRSLKDKHGETHQPYQSRLWAELALGSHKSEDELPNLPIFRNKAMKKSSPGAGQVSTSKAETTSPASYSRSDILRQL
ncbi:hypothetical protein P5673_014823 [Acropora cervicornis]|uniref:Uncharacterized protein n=1 Tax=Acropora cervicornis TaxID=6130 RepID=A0AAD9QIQ2_ACRCE|nr:hypothetical protein P5673_014823 [Acropora cervicornis]